MTRRSQALLYATLGASILVAPAAAQDADEGVVVSATRTERRNLDIPGSIYAVGAEALRDGKPKVNLSESLGRVPGMVLQNRGNYAQEVFPAKYQAGLFSAQHGSWNRMTPIGARIMFTSLKSDGTADKAEVIAESWLDGDTGLYRGRPIDVAMMKDGAMLISDDFAGATA